VQSLIQDFVGTAQPSRRNNRYRKLVSERRWICMSDRDADARQPGNSPGDETSVTSTKICRNQFHARRTDGSVVVHRFDTTATCAVMSRMAI